MEQAWNSTTNSFTSVFGGDEADGSLLLMPQIGIVAPSDPRFLGTLDFIEKRLRRGNYLYCYAAADDFGVPETAFSVCTFWLIDALQDRKSVGQGKRVAVRVDLGGGRTMYITTRNKLPQNKF